MRIAKQGANLAVLASRTIERILVWYFAAVVNINIFVNPCSSAPPKTGTSHHLCMYANTFPYRTIMRAHRQLTPLHFLINCPSTENTIVITWNYNAVGTYRPPLIASRRGISISNIQLDYRWAEN